MIVKAEATMWTVEQRNVTWTVEKKHAAVGKKRCDHMWKMNNRTEKAW